MTKYEAIQKLFGHYLSRNKKSLRFTIAELGWPIDTLDRIEKLGMVKKMEFGPENTHYERVLFREGKDKEVKLLIEKFDLK